MSLIELPTILRSSRSGGLVRASHGFCAKVGFTSDELAARALLDWIDPDDHACVRALVEAGKGSCRVGHRTRSGSSIRLDLQVSGQGPDAMVLGRWTAAAAPLGTDDTGVDEGTVNGTLETIARIVEEQNPGYRCSILLVADGRLVNGAGPSLPDDYNAAINGHAIGPTVGSCGTAIYWGIPVIAEDIQRDPLWSTFADLAKRAGLAACWSHPFTSRSGRVLGALALYAPEPRAPTDEQLSCLRAAARMSGLAVERGRAEEALRRKRERELELEEQLRRAAKMEALGVLVGGVAHDFNNVLATILGNAELALELDSGSAEIVEMLNDIVGASRRAANFCQQLLACAGHEARNTSRFELGALIPEVGGLVQAALSENTRLKYALQDEPIFVEGDENQLLQVIMNLVTNAADALGEDDGHIVVGTALARYEASDLSHLAPAEDLSAGEYVRLTVSDTGCGMDADTMSRVFDPFFTTKFAGHGLGLAAAQGIVRTHGGMIQIESEPGEGTTFTILLPTAKAPEREEPVNGHPVPDLAPIRILVADDDESLRSIMCKRLRYSGFDVVEAADGQQAIDRFWEDPDSIDCVLLDLSMPRRGGEEVQRELRAVRPNLPVILMSGCAEREILERLDGADISGTLQKPVPAAELLEAIRDAMA